MMQESDPQDRQGHSADEPAQGESGGEARPEAEASKPAKASAGLERNPWHTPRVFRPAALDEVLGRRRDDKPRAGAAAPRLSLPFGLRPDADWAMWLVGGALVVWLGLSSVHQLGAGEQGLVSTLGQYSGTIGSGVSLSLPWPLQSVRVVDVRKVQTLSLPQDGENLVLTSDQGLVDLAYQLRWTVKDARRFAYGAKDAKALLREATEAAMRASVAQARFADMLSGQTRAEVERGAVQRAQALLDQYQAGIKVEGLEITRAQAPARLAEASQKVQAAQAERARNIANAQAYAQQVVARAQGDAAAFDIVYAQYKLAPEVTRKRMYYTTMERVLYANDKVVGAAGATPTLPAPQRKPAEGEAVVAAPGAGK
jgi:modulator of FtsH protease HflK